ncbi:MAG: phenyltransferase domain-containing protein [Desulfobacterales bacterium]|nr:phenyltransferase domain-containing protein [Desulfobacterales bacterium]MBF0397262.1 phenyltransferase domain-containing protein [Desulfobacterales bacterium]
MYKANISPKNYHLFVDVKGTAKFIANVQKENGEIPWAIDDKTDPWDHIESAMGLTVGGFYDASRKAYEWSKKSQMNDGSFWSYYRNGEPDKGAYKDTNMTSYIAVGVLHYYLATKDINFLNEMWLTIESAIDYVINMQGEDGEIFWAKRNDGTIDKTVLLTGCSSIYMSISCALKIASILNKEKPEWRSSRKKLGNAIKNMPHLFDQSKSRYSMDWYYPILCGAISRKDAQKRIELFWDTFIIAGWGVRCVSDRPWLTIAESSELVMSLAAMGKFEAAEMVFSWILDKKYEDGSFWTGYTYPDKVIYTTDKTTWTAAAVLMAADILYGLTSASNLFKHDFLK